MNKEIGFYELMEQLRPQLPGWQEQYEEDVWITDLLITDSGIMAVIREGERFWRAPVLADADGPKLAPKSDWQAVEHVEEWRPKSINVCVKRKTKDKVIIGGYGILYSSTKDRDLENDYFAKDTDFWLDRMPGAKPVLYEHGQHDVIKKMSLGNTIEFKSDSVGLYVEAELDRHNQYIDTVLELVNKGVLGWSSGAVSHLVERSKDGLLKSWPIAEMTLTVAPAEPRLLGVSELRSLFEAGINIPFPEGPEEATDLDDMELVEEFEVDLLDYLPFLAG